MKASYAILALILLTACVPIPVAPVKNVTTVSEPQQVIFNRTAQVPPPFTTVVQQRRNDNITWGYDEAGNLVLVNGTAKTSVLSYENDKLVRIDDGVKPLTLAYDSEGRLVGAEKGIRKWAFTYNSRGQLVEMRDDENLHVLYDSKQRLSSVARDSGTSTEFAYDSRNRTNAMYRFGIKTDLAYDSESRLKLLARADDHLVLAYWRYNLLSSLSGTMYGMKETVNYGPNDIELISNVEKNDFASLNPALPERRFHAFNTFLFCTRFRKLPVIFDGQSWVIFHEYMKGDIKDYLLISYVCDFLP